MTADSIGFALLALGVVLLLAKVVRVKWRLMQNLFIPASIIGGFIGLALGPEVFGRIASALGTDRFEDGLFGENVFVVWETLPELLISVVFATLFLGERLPNPKRAAKLAGPQLSVGVAYGSGQYVLGLLLAIFILTPVFGLTPMAGALIELGFEGGHGTAAGMRPVFEQLDFEEGIDIALGLATVGVVGGVVIGVTMINWAVRTGRAQVLDAEVDRSAHSQAGIYREGEQPPAAMMTSQPSSIEPLALHFAFIALSIMVGWVMLEGLQALERALWADTIEMFAFIPLFPLAMLGGVVVQLILDKSGQSHILDHEFMSRIQGFSLDVLILSALATLSLTVIADNLGPFLIMAVAGTVFNVLIMMFLVKRVIKEFWFERGIGDFGQSMGVTATGLILIQIADPEHKTPSLEAFGYKQLLYEPFFGGGLITAAAIPFIYQFGPWPLLITMAVVFVVSVGTGILYFGKQNWKTQDLTG